MKSRTEVDGIYGVGMKVDVAPPQPFVVTRVVDLQDPEGQSMSFVAFCVVSCSPCDAVWLAGQNSVVRVGDVLQYVDDRATLKVRRVAEWQDARSLTVFKTLFRMEAALSKSESSGVWIPPSSSL